MAARGRVDRRQLRICYWSSLLLATFQNAIRRVVLVRDGGNSGQCGEWNDDREEQRTARLPHGILLYTSDAAAAIMTRRKVMAGPQERRLSVKRDGAAVTFELCVPEVAP